MIRQTEIDSDLNDTNTRGNNAANNAVATAKTANSGEYTSEDETIIRGVANIDDETKSAIDNQYKDFYRDKKLHKGGIPV